MYRRYIKQYADSNISKSKLEFTENVRKKQMNVMVPIAYTSKSPPLNIAEYKILEINIGVYM